MTYPIERGSQHLWAPGRYRVAAPNLTAQIPVFSSSDQSVRMIAQLPDQCEIEVLGQSGIYLAVVLPNGKRGYLVATGLRLIPVSAPGASISKPQYATGSKAGTGSIILGGTIASLCSFAIIIGIFFVSTAQESCPIDFGSSPAVNPYSSACTVLGYPYVGAGVVLLIVGAIGLIVAIRWVRGRMRRFK